VTTFGIPKLSKRLGSRQKCDGNATPTDNMSRKG
jgi:hypothetical protein